MIKSYNFTLDVRGRNNVPIIECVQGDTNSYELNISLIDGELPINLTDQTARLVCQKADGTTVFQDFTIINALTGNISTVLSTNSITCLGNVKAEIKIYGLNTELLTGTRFDYRVIPSFLNEATVVSTNDFSTLTTALSDIALAKEDVGIMGALNTQIQADITTGNALDVTLLADIATGNTLNGTLGTDIATGNTTHTTLQADIALAQQNTFATEVTNARGGKASVDARLVTIESKSTTDNADITAKNSNGHFKITSKDFGGVSNGSTNDSVAVASAIASANVNTLNIPANTVYTDPIMPAKKTLKSIGNGFLTGQGMRGNDHSQGISKLQVPAFSIGVRSDISEATISNQAFTDEFNIHNVVGSAPAGRASVSSHFHVLSIGSRYGALAGDGLNLDLVSMGGHYVEHRSDVAIVRGFASEDAFSVYGSGSAAVARGTISTAQVVDVTGSSYNSVVGALGSGSINLAVGSDGSAQVLGVNSTGNISTAIGAQGNAYNQGKGVISQGVGVRSQVLNTGLGSIATAFNFTNVNTVSGGSISALTGMFLTNTVPTNLATIGVLQGLNIAKQTGGTQNRTAGIQGDLHITTGQRVILGGGGAIYDETPKGSVASIYSEGGIVYFDTVTVAKSAFVMPNGVGTKFRTPVSAVESGLQGQICFDANFVYFWTANAAVKKVALTAF